MSEPFAKRYYHLLQDVEDWITRGHRVEHEPFLPRKPESPGLSGTRGTAGAPGPAGEGSVGDTDGGKEAAATALSREDRLRRIEELVLSCTRCPLHQGRSRAVPGQGVLDPDVMVIGEGPGAEEDRQGLPFVGPAGQYLDKWLAAIEVYRDNNAYIANIVKCRPPNNRDPKPEEAALCMPYLEEQIELIRPKSILTVGRVALRYLIGVTEGIGRIHGTLYQYKGIPLMPTYHPSGVLRNPEYRRPVWEDLKKLRDQVLRPQG
jgi:DNA polymerase